MGLGPPWGRLSNCGYCDSLIRNRCSLGVCRQWWGGETDTGEIDKGEIGGDGATAARGWAVRDAENEQICVAAVALSRHVFERGVALEAMSSLESHRLLLGHLTNRSLGQATFKVWQDTNICTNAYQKRTNAYQRVPNAYQKRTNAYQKRTKNVPTCTKSVTHNI